MDISLLAISYELDEGQFFNVVAEVATIAIDVDGQGRVTLAGILGSRLLAITQIRSALKNH
ncbi:MAG: hypothetical protein ABIE70_05215 [bacterium]